MFNKTIYLQFSCKIDFINVRFVWKINYSRLLEVGSYKISRQNVSNFHKIFLKIYFDFRNTYLFDLGYFIIRTSADKSYSKSRLLNYKNTKLNLKIVYLRNVMIYLSHKHIFLINSHVILIFFTRHINMLLFGNKVKFKFLKYLICEIFIIQSNFIAI